MVLVSYSVETRFVETKILQLLIKSSAMTEVVLSFEVVDYQMYRSNSKAILRYHYCIEYFDIKDNVNKMIYRYFFNRNF